MTLRARLTLLIGISLSLLWLGLAVWMQHDLVRQMQSALDRRLEMAANMAASLVASRPGPWPDGAAQKKLLALAPEEHDELACQVMSKSGEVLAHTAGAGPLRDLLRTSRPGFATRMAGGVQLRTYTLEVNGLRVTTADRMVERARLSHNMMLTAVVPFLVALAGGLLVLWFGVASGLLPLERLRQALARRRPDQLAPVPRLGMPVDLLPFVDTLNEMLERIQTTLARERRFTSDAAHELRTPLTAIKIHLDVVRLTHGPETSAALGYVEEGVARLQHTLAQLLTLAQVEGPASWAGDQPARAGEVAFLAMRDAAPDNGGDIVIDGDGCAVLAMPQALAVTALRNLLDNARRHAPPGTVVELALCADAAQASFVVRDRGPGMSDEELARATERFWRRGTGHGSGLGLSVVAAIAERFGGTLTLSRRAGGGLEARLTLPRAREESTIA
jgi:two-component system sensor histidine kinase QseC